VKVYSFNGSNVLSLVGTATTSGRSQFVAWSPDGRFFATVTNDLNTLHVFRFSGSTPVLVGNPVTTGSTPYAVDWSPDGRFLVVANRGDSTLQVYRFNGSSEPTTVGGTVITGNNPLSVVWSPDGRFLAVGCGGTSNTLQIFRCNYYYTGQPSATQSFSNGLVFGDKVKGAAFDADVRVLGSATVKINGMVKDDSA
jgi:WD40 repeat protein